MSLPDAVRKGPPTVEHIAPFHSHRAVPEPPVWRTQLAPAARPVPRSIEEIQRLLRKRLRFFAAVISGGIAVLLLVVFVPEILVAGDKAGFTVYCVVCALVATAAWLLWGTRPLSLGQLRTIELIVFGALVACVVWTHYDFFVRLWEPGRDRFHAALWASAEGLPWVILIVFYGIFIPNTWRRCTALVGVTALIPLVLSTASGLGGGAMEGRPLVTLVTVMGVWLGLAAAVAVYGSYRIELLRQEAVEARRLGQYQLKQRLGAGGMGEVYLAEHALLRRPCAVKIIRPDRAGDPETLARFEREVQATAALTHPNTVQVFDYGRTEDGTFYYAMEYLQGATLDELVRRGGPLPPARAVHLLRQVAGALAEAHRNGLIHRDLKPGNIIACERGGRPDVAKLLDFGLVGTARPAEGGPANGGRLVLGTPAYMSPEQASPGRDLDARSDLYSLGAVAYFLLTGRPPFVRATLKLTLAAHQSDPVTRPDWARQEVPEDVSAVVLRCLEKDPALRFQDAAALEGAFAACQCAGLWTAEQAAAANASGPPPGPSVSVSPTGLERMAGFDL